MKSLSDSERRDWLRLARTPNVGPVTFAALLERFGSAASAIDAIPRLASRGGAAKVTIPEPGVIEREMDELSRIGGCFVASCDPEFPPGLAAIDPPPPILAVIGSAGLLLRDMIAVVGARNASALGRKFASTVAGELADAGLVVASGMARGIDAAAHAATISTGTCAVMAGGVNVVYPVENRELYDLICAQGVAVSEMPMSESPQARHFPRRNRIISGLSRGVLVIEAAERSGSLITARYALEQGREVFAVPGSPLDPRSRGANQLIRDGATLTESAADILSVLLPIVGSAFREPQYLSGPSKSVCTEADVDQTRAPILDLLSSTPVEVDDLVRQSGIPSPVIMTALLELQLAGRVERHPGNRVSLL